MNSHIHQTELGVVFHFFLTKECHLRIGVHSSRIDEITGLNKHTARTACRIEHYALFRFQHIDQHFYQRLWSKENPIVAGYSFRKF